MRKLFLKSITLLFLLLLSINTAWAEDQKVYVASLKAQSSTASTGSGQVQLTWLDITGTPITPTKQLGSIAIGEGKFNPSNPAALGTTSQMIGGTMFAMDGVEMPIEYPAKSQIYMTSFLYFLAEGKPANGSYLDSWAFADPAITRIDTAMGDGNTIPFKSPCFKVLPDTVNGGVMNTQKLNTAIQNVTKNPNNIYAIFKKYLLSNPVVVNNGVAGTSVNSTTTLDLYVDIEGDMSQLKPMYADFSLPAPTFMSDDDVEWSWALAANPSEILSATKGRAHVVITFKAKKDIPEGTYRATFPVKMQGTNPSALDIKLSVYARPESANEASVKIGEAEPTEYKTLADAVAAANGASGDVTLTILKNIEVSSSVTLSNTMTLDLNGYVLSAAATAAPGPGMVGQPVLKVAGAGKTVTLAYNKQGGAIQAAPAVGAFGVMGGLGVEVAAGTLVLNGGTIASENALTTYTEAAQTAAVKVDAGAKLIQNGATITATSAGPNAIGIYNEGTVQIKNGSISAEAGFNNAMAVYALNGSSTTIDGGSLSALAKEQDGTTTFNPVIPNGIPTWTNAYAVNVVEGSTVTVNGGDLYAEATNATRAYAVSALAGFGGKLTINKGATVRAKSPNTMYSFPVALMAGDVTINGGKFDGKYMDNTTGETNNPAVFGVDYSKFTFVSGTCMTEMFFTEDDRFPTSSEHPTYKNYSVINGSKDYTDGYRYIAVAEDADPAVAVPACRIGSMGYNTLEDAIAYANNHPSEEVVIFMLRDYTLPAGYYTLPAKATLVVPMSDEQSKETNKYAPRVSFHDMDCSHPYIEPTEYRRLTFANGVNMDVFGQIELTCTQFSSNEAYTSQPYGPYGRLVMEEGSHMTLQKGSELRAWGYMTGKGETDARRGATVREMFQMGDWKGAATSVKITGMAPQVLDDDSKYKIFPVTQYFIQNIESPVKYHPGAVLSTSATVAEGLSGKLAVTMTATDIKIVGVSGTDEAIFLMGTAADADNTWVRKWYDAENDIQVYDINSGAHIGSMVLDMGELAMLGIKLPVRLNSAKFDLPITSNFKIHLLSGSMDFLQNTSLLPGAEVEVDKEAIVSVAMSKSEQTAYEAYKDSLEKSKSDPKYTPTIVPVLYTGALYVYDKEDWGQYAYGNAYNAETKSNETYKAYTKVVRYAPSWNGRPTKRDEQICPPSAAINVHGTFKTATGFVYTSEHGANIFSSNEDAGTFVFNEDASTAETRTVNQVEGVGTYKDKTFYPARLKQGDGSYVNTEDAKEGDAYCYQNDEWSNMIVDPDNECFMVKLNDNGNIYYAKPAEFVAVEASKIDGELSGNDDHTYSDADGAGRLFILMDEGCQWWEVEKKDNLYHCIHPNNDTYYYWDEDNTMWTEKHFTITWKNWNGDIIQTADKDGVLQDSYSVTYGTTAEFLGTNPTHPEDVDYTYDFIGWSPALGKVTSDVTYMASFEQKPRMYTIIFQNEGEVEIERHFLTRNEIPVCKNVPTKVGHHLIWSPAISKVIGDQTYIATWEENLPTEWNVNFVNNAQGELQATTVVSVNEHPTYFGETPKKENADHTPYTSNEYTYTFWGWSAVIDGVEHQFAAGDKLPSPTAPTTYTAVYTQAAKTYSVNFITYKGNADNDNHVITSESYTYGATPIAPAADEVRDKIALGTTPNYKFNDEKYTYSFAWDPQIQTVIESQDYVAVIDSVINRYTITLKANPSGACVFTGAGTFDYGTRVENVTVSYNSNEYEFQGWSDLSGDAQTNTTHSAFTLTEDKTIVANFRYTGNDKVTIHWMSEDGKIELATSEPKKGSASTYTGATPTKAATAQNTFTFDGWTTAANGAGTYYKNGMTPKATSNATYYAHFAATPIPNLDVNSVSGPTVLSEPVTYHDLVITSNGVTSAQLIGENYLTLTGDAYFDLAINAQDHKWYAIAVPWDVDPANGVSVGGRTLKFGKEFDILYYDGKTRALEGTTGNAWKYLETDPDPIDGGLLKPGKLYMIGLTHEAPVIRFKANNKLNLLNTTTSVAENPSGNSVDAGWNGIANPALFNAYVNAGVTLGQVYNASINSYSTINLDSKKLVLGQPVFVQAPVAKSITVTYGGAYAAPRRAKAQTENTEYDVRIAPANAAYTDRLFVAVDDKENDTYTIGQDLAKMGVSTIVAQMWVNRYNTKLCQNTVAPVNGTAEFPLTISAPQEGRYVISIDQSALTAQNDLYLTYDGEVIWNLTNSAYTTTLQQGTDTHYGLRIKVENAPEVATDITEAIVDSKDTTANKVLINGHVFIIRGERAYTIDGQLVK